METFFGVCHFLNAVAVTFLLVVCWQQDKRIGELKSDLRTQQLDNVQETRVRLRAEERIEDLETAAKEFFEDIKKALVNYETCASRHDE